MGYEFVNDTGVIVADTSDVLTEVQDEYKGVFGDDIDLDPETPEGILIISETASRVGIATNNAQLANQINPNIAGGIFLDALWALTGGVRSAATNSTFATNPDLTGVASTIIPIESIAANSNGDQFETLAEVTLDGSGLGNVAFRAIETGVITCGIADLTSIVDGPLGWETVTNTVAATPGVEQQSDISARRERGQTLAAQGVAISLATSSNVRAAVGVTSLSYRENITNGSLLIDGVTLVAHSVWACVSGGTDVAVAQALLDSKSVGANWNLPAEALAAGAVEVTENVVDVTSGQSYEVKFNRPADIPVLYEVTINATTISNVSSIIKNAILDYAAGLIDGEDGLVTGADVSAFEAAGAISIVEPGVTISLVRVTTVAAASFSTTTIAIDLFEKASVADADAITVIVSP